ncbi:hypothetical protein M5Y82_10395, partial [Neisseria meningitidis]|nr:hypothetical protein [Neisseria meningitidis]
MPTDGGKQNAVRSPEFQTAYSQRRTSRRRERKGLLEAAQHLAEIKNLIRQRHDEFPQKNPTESIDRFSLWAYSS